MSRIRNTGCTSCRTDLYLNHHVVQTRGAVEGLLPQGELKEEHHTQLKYQLPIAETKLPVVFR